MRVLNSRGGWDIDNKVGFVELLVQAGSASKPQGVMFNGLDGTSVAAMLALLNSGDQIEYDPKTRMIFARE